jgi:hypothetical protein
VNDDTVTLIEQTAVICCEAVADWTSGVDERLSTETECHVSLIVKCVPVEDDFRIAHHLDRFQIS